MARGSSASSGRNLLSVVDLLKGPNRRTAATREIGKRPLPRPETRGPLAALVASPSVAERLALQPVY